MLLFDTLTGSFEVIGPRAILFSIDLTLPENVILKERMWLIQGMKEITERYPSVETWHAERQGAVLFIHVVGDFNHEAVRRYG